MPPEISASRATSVYYVRRKDVGMYWLLVAETMQQYLQRLS
jgi:hypothetical protein